MENSLFGVGSSPRSLINPVSLPQSDGFSFNLLQVFLQLRSTKDLLKPEARSYHGTDLTIWLPGHGGKPGGKRWQLRVGDKLMVDGGAWLRKMRNTSLNHIETRENHMVPDGNDMERHGNNVVRSHHQLATWKPETGWTVLAVVDLVLLPPMAYQWVRC